MYFALGFLVSGLFALLFLPAFWRRAIRLSTRRLEMQLPLSMDEIVAERDQLRAEFALERRRVEQRAEELALAHAKDMAELGRRYTRVVALEGELSEALAESERRATRLASLGEDLAAAETEIGVAHQVLADVEGRLNNKTIDLATLTTEHQALADVVDEHRATVASLETRIVGHQSDIEGLRSTLETIRRENLDLAHAVATAEGDRDDARAELASVATRRDQSLAQVREMQERAEELEQAHRTERRNRMRVETEAASRASALALAESREAALRETQAGAELALRGREQALLQRIEDLKSQNSALQGALDALRRDSASRRRDVANDAGPYHETPSLDTSEAAALRQAITDIGAKVSRMVDALERDETADRGSNLPDRVRALQREASQLGAAE
jgi:hypothetical protein